MEGPGRSRALRRATAAAGSVGPLVLAAARAGLATEADEGEGGNDRNDEKYLHHTVHDCDVKSAGAHIKLKVNNKIDRAAFAARSPVAAPVAGAA